MARLVLMPNDSYRVVRLRDSLIGFAILFAGSLGMYLNGQSVSENERAEIRNDGRVVAINGCNGRYADRVELRALLLASKAATKVEVKKGRISEARGARALKFYEDRLEGLPLPDCRKADDALEVKDADLPIPPARFPCDAQAVKDGLCPKG